jgi:hypothetical protein
MLTVRAVRYRRAFMPVTSLSLASGPIQKPETPPSSAGKSEKLSNWTFVGATFDEHAPMPVGRCCSESSSSPP